MSTKKAQAIANLLEEELGFSITSYQNSDLEFLKGKLEEFLDLGVDTEDLHDPELASPDDFDSDDDGNGWEAAGPDEN